MIKGRRWGGKQKKNCKKKKGRRNITSKERSKGTNRKQSGT